MTVKCTAALITKFPASGAATLMSLDRFQKRGVDSNSREFRSAGFCNQGGRCASICLLTLQLDYCDWCRTVWFMKLALEVVTLNDEDFVEVILLLK